VNHAFIYIICSTYILDMQAFDSNTSSLYMSYDDPFLAVYIGFVGQLHLGSTSLKVVVANSQASFTICKTLLADTSVPRIQDPKSCCYS